MKKKGKLRILCWITTIAMMLSIFNIPLMGYATEGAEPSTSSGITYSVKVQTLDENYDIVEKSADEGAYNITGTYFNKNDNTPYYVFLITGEDAEGNSVELSDANSINVRSDNSSVALVADGDGNGGSVEDAAQSISVTPNGAYSYFSVYYVGNGKVEFTVTIDGEVVDGFVSFVDLPLCEDCGKYSCVCEDDDSEICDNCGLSIEEECTCGTDVYCSDCGETIENCVCGADDSDDERICDICDIPEDECYCWDPSIESLDLTYTLAGGGEYTETIYFDEDSTWTEVYLRPYDTEKPVTITGIGANGEPISEEVIFDEDSEYDYIDVLSVSVNGNSERTYSVDVYRPIGPMVEVTYYIGDEKVTEAQHYRDTDYRYVGIPYAYNSDKEISVIITHLDGMIETPEIEWEDAIQGWVYFDSIVNGENTRCTLDIYKESASSDNNCSIKIEVFDEEGNSRDFTIDSEKAANEEGVIVTVPYGYDERIQLYASPDDEYAQLEGFYGEGEEELGYSLVSVDEPKLFKVIAENGNEKLYKLIFEVSEGTSADIDMYVKVRDETLANSDWYGALRNIPVDFTEDEDGNKTAEVVLPYLYDYEQGIELCIEGNDSYDISYKDNEDNWFFIGEDGEGVAEFTVTSPNGEITKSYSIEFTKESETDSQKTDLEIFTLDYIDENGINQQINIDPADASDEDGATVTIPKEIFTEDLDEYYVNVYAKLAGYSYINGKYISGSCDGESDSDYIDYNFDINWEKISTIAIDVISSNGQNMTTYKLNIVNGARANEADIYDVEIQYTPANDDEPIDDYIDLDDETYTGRYTLYPYDDTQPIFISGIGADGSEIYKQIIFEEGRDEATVTFTSTSPDGDNEITYTVTVVKPKHPVVNVYYKDDGICSWECDFSSGNKDKIFIPYNYDKEYGIQFDITLLDGSKLDPAPEIVWENETREDEHDPLIGKAQFEANGITYTIDIEVEGISSNKNAYMYMNVWDGESYDEWGDEVYKYINIDSEEAASEEGVVVTIPYGYEENAYFYIYEEGSYATIEGYDEDGNEYSNIVVPGETRIYTVIAQDGTKQDYKITFVESTGNSTAIEADVAVLKSLGEFEYEYYNYLEFEKNDDGVMETDVILPFDYSTEDGILLYDYSSEDVTYSIPLEENINVDLDADPSLEFTVTSANGQVTQDYIINFSRETAEDAAKAELGYMDISYTDETGKYIETEIDLEKVQDGNIVINIPENIWDNYFSVYVSTDGYAYVSRFAEANTDHEIMGKADPDWFNASIIRIDKEDIVFEFDITSSDLKNTKTYTVTVKTIHECKWDAGVVTEPTCTEKGFTTYKCSCGNTYKDNYVDAKKHSFGEWKVTTAPTCTTDGVETRTCLCGEKETRALGKTGHSYTAVVTAPTCTEAGYTTYTCACGDTYKTDEVAALGHTPGAFKTVKKATFSKAGKQEAKCAACQQTVTKEIAKAVVPVIADQTFNNKNKTPKVTVKNEEGAKVSAKATFATKSRKAVGKYKVTVKLTGADYEGSKKIYFKINPKGVGISKLSKGKKSITVKWKKPSSTYRKQMTGYQIRYSTSSDMSKAKTVTVKGTSAKSKTIKKLKAKKYYYVQLRTYKTVKGAKYYSGWSKTKKIRTK